MCRHGGLRAWIRCRRCGTSEQVLLRRIFQPCQTSVAGLKPGAYTKAGRTRTWDLGLFRGQGLPAKPPEDE